MPKRKSKKGFLRERCITSRNDGATEQRSDKEFAILVEEEEQMRSPTKIDALFSERTDEKRYR